MAKSSDESKKEEPQSSGPQGAPATGQPQRPQIQVDDSKAVACYGNFCRVNGTPEELIIDIGLNKQPMGVPTEPLEVTQRIIVNYFTAKRLLAALQMAVQRHEAAFGVLETDVQRRVRPEVFQAAQAAQAQARAQAEAQGEQK